MTKDVSELTASRYTMRVPPVSHSKCVLITYDYNIFIAVKGHKYVSSSVRQLCLSFGLNADVTLRENNIKQ